jgi:hypothetical protein
MQYRTFSVQVNLSSGDKDNDTTLSLSLVLKVPMWKLQETAVDQGAALPQGAPFPFPFIGIAMRTSWCCLFVSGLGIPRRSKAATSETEKSASVDFFARSNRDVTSHRMVITCFA